MIGTAVAIAAAVGAAGWGAAVITLFRGIGPVAARSPSPASATLEQDLMALSAEAQAFVDRINAVRQKVPAVLSAADTAAKAQLAEDMSGIAEALTGLESDIAAASPPEQPAEQPQPDPQPEQPQ